MRESCVSAANDWVQNGCHVCRQADYFQAEVKVAHQMHHKDNDSGSEHMPTKQWTDTIDPFGKSHEQGFKLQGRFFIDRIESVDRAFTTPALHLQPSNDSSRSLEFVM